MAEPAEMINTLRATGHRLTPQREFVLQVIARSDAHITAEGVLRAVRKRYRYLNKSAVYRTLDLLVQLGFVTQTDLGQGRIEYELHRHPHHHHLICRHCGHVRQIDHALLKRLERGLFSQHGFRAELDHFAIYGTCRKCEGKMSKREGRDAHS